MARSIHTLTIPSSTRFLDDVRRFVEQHAQEAAFSEEDVARFKLAVDEACTNVIEHAYGEEEHHEIDVAVIIDSDRLTISIRDEGRAFDRTRYSPPDIFEYVKRRRGGGLGVHLMHQLMDQVEYQSHGGANEVRLTKYRNGTK